MDLLVNIDVGDLADGIAFYTNAFGLTRGRQFGESGIELLGASSTIYLLAKEAGSVATATGTRRTYERHWTPVHLDFVVDDVDDAVTQALVAGATLEEVAADTPWGRIAMLADPFGNGVCVLSFNDRGYDAIATAG